MPKFYLDFLSPITTHYDVLYNRAIELERRDEKHGSCGAGYGATIERQKNLSLHFVVKDILDVATVINKLEKIKQYYSEKIERETCYRFIDFDHHTEDIRFLNYIEKIRFLIENGIVNLTNEYDILHQSNPWENFVFEGAQGILLDVNFGFKPHVTKSNTTSQNAFDIINRNFATNEIEVEIYYVTRGYHTRHGAGPFLNSMQKLNLKHNNNETNFFNLYQGDFRIGHLDIDLVNYSLKCDNFYSNNIDKNILITCLDQMESSQVGIIVNGILEYVRYNELPKLLNCTFKTCSYSFGNKAENIKSYTNT